jgi:tetratricopeptide (TPR) repeat protein
VIFVDVSSTEQPGEFKTQLTKTEPADPYAPDESARSLEQEPSVALDPNPEALRQYQLGKYFQSRRASDDLELAIRQFRSAVEIDPGFADAWVGLAGSLWVFSCKNTPDSPILRQEMLFALEKALELDPDNPEANARISAYYYNRGQLDLSGQHFDRALEFGRDNSMVMAFSAGIAFYVQNYPEAIAYQQQAVALDPLSYVNHTNLAVFLKSAGRLNESIQAFQAALELNPDADEEFLTDFLQTYILIGQPGQAEALALKLTDGSARQQSLAMVYLVMGSPARSRHMIEQLEAEPDIESALRLAEYYAFSGDFDGAFQWLDQARLRQSGVDGNRPAGIYFEEISHSPFLQRLISDPRWNDWQKYVQDQTLNRASDTSVVQLNG